MEQFGLPVAREGLDIVLLCIHSGKTRSHACRRLWMRAFRLKDRLDPSQGICSYCN